MHFLLLWILSFLFIEQIQKRIESEIKCVEQNISWAEIQIKVAYCVCMAMMYLFNVYKSVIGKFVDNDI